MTLLGDLTAWSNGVWKLLYTTISQNTKTHFLYILLCSGSNLSCFFTNLCFSILPSGVGKKNTPLSNHSLCYFLNNNHKFSVSNLLVILVIFHKTYITGKKTTQKYVDSGIKCIFFNHLGKFYGKETILEKIIIIETYEPTHS